MINTAIELIANAKRPLFYTGGVINSGQQASQLLREFVQLTGHLITSTLMGLGLSFRRLAMARYARYAWHL